MNIFAIDLSIRATGLAMLSTDGDGDALTPEDLPCTSRLICDIHGMRYQGGLAIRTSQDRLAQTEDILLPVLSWAMHAHQVIIEEYSFGSMSSSTDLIHELGGVIKYHLRKLGQAPVEISPKSVKKFIAGNGNADKDVMLACVQKMGMPILDHNMADAFGLARFGHALQLPDSSLVSMHHTEREAIHAVRHPKVKVRPQKEPKLWAK